MASNAPSKIYFNYLAKKAIRDLERKNQRAGSALSLRGGAARKKQWALLRKIQQKRAAGGKKEGQKQKKGRERNAVEDAAPWAVAKCKNDAEAGVGSEE